MDTETIVTVKVKTKTNEFGGGIQTVFCWLEDVTLASSQCKLFMLVAVIQISVHPESVSNGIQYSP